VNTTTTQAIWTAITVTVSVAGQWTRSITGQKCTSADAIKWRVICQWSRVSVKRSRQAGKKKINGNRLAMEKQAYSCWQLRCNKPRDTDTQYFCEYWAGIMW